MLILGRKNNRQNKHLNWKAICTFTFTYKESKWAEKAEIKMQITRTLSLSLTHSLSGTVCKQKFSFTHRLTIENYHRRLPNSL